MFNWIEEETGFRTIYSKSIAVVVGLLLGLLIVYNATVDFVDNYELGYIYDARNGQITMLDRTGYFVTLPFVQKVHTVDLRPMQVCINANSRVLNCKLVQFNAAGINTLLEWHGRKDYNESNLPELLKSYAYDGSNKSYPFLIIKRELKPDEK